MSQYTGVDADTSAIGSGAVAPTHLMRRLANNSLYHTEQGPHQTWTWMHGDTQDTDPNGPVDPVGATRADYETKQREGFLNFLPSTAPLAMAYDETLAGLPLTSATQPLPIRATTTARTDMKRSDMDVYVVGYGSGLGHSLKVTINRTQGIPHKPASASSEVRIYRYTIPADQLPAPVTGIVAEHNLRVGADNNALSAPHDLEVTNIRYRQFVEVDALWTDNWSGLRDPDTCPGRYPLTITLPDGNWVRVAQVRPARARREPASLDTTVDAYGGPIELVLERPLGATELVDGDTISVARIGSLRLLSVTAQTVTRVVLSSSRPIPAERTTTTQVDTQYIRQASALDLHRPLVGWMMNSASPLSTRKAYLVTEGTALGAPSSAPKLIAQQPQTDGEWNTHSQGHWVQNDLMPGANELRQNNYRYEYWASDPQFPGEFTTANRFYSTGIPYITRAWDSQVRMDEGVHYAAPAEEWSRSDTGPSGPVSGRGIANIVRQVNNLWVARDGSQGQPRLFTQNFEFNNCSGDAPLIGWPYGPDGRLLPTTRDPIQMQLLLDLEEDPSLPTTAAWDVPLGDRQNLRPPMGQGNFLTGWPDFALFNKDGEDGIKYMDWSIPADDFTEFRALGPWTFDFITSGHGNPSGSVYGRPTRVQPPVFPTATAVAYSVTDYAGGAYLQPVTEGIVSNINPTNPPNTSDPSVKGVATANYGVYGTLTDYMDNTSSPGNVLFATDKQYIIEAVADGWNAPGLLHSAKQNRRLIEYRYYRAARTR